MAQASDIIYDALRLLGVLTPGRTASPESMADGLVYLNDLIDNWNTQFLTRIYVPQQQFQLTAGQQVYSSGPSGNWGGFRLLKLISAGILITSAGGPSPLRQPLEIIDDPEDWWSIPIKNTPSTNPTRVFLETSFPLANVYFWPVPSVNVMVDIEAWTQLSNFAALTSTANLLPPGYRKAMRYNLAVDLFPMFQTLIKIPQPQIQLIVDTAKSALGDLKRSNITTIESQCDPAVLGSPRLWNWLTGDYQR